MPYKSGSMYHLYCSKSRTTERVMGTLDEAIRAAEKLGGYVMIIDMFFGGPWYWVEDYENVFEVPVRGPAIQLKQIEE